jgi:hypothetical protein
MSKLLFCILLLTPSMAWADEHMIRPTCWEENVDGVMQRHCSVNRPTQAAKPPTRTAVPISGPQEAAEPPPMPPPAAPSAIAHGPSYPYAPGYGYTSTLGPYGPRGGYYGPPPYYGPPLAVLRFGPFGVVIP